MFGKSRSRTSRIAFFTTGCVPANVENRITAQKIQVGVVIHVVEISAFSPGVDLVETNDALGRDQGAIDMSMMQLVIFAEPCCNDFFQVKRHSRTFSDLGAKSKRGHRDQRSPLQLFLETIGWIEQSPARWRDSIVLKVSNLDTLPARQPAGLFFQVNVVPVVWRAIGTIQKSFANRCAGVLPRCRVLIYARRDELCRQPNRRPRAMERFAHKRSSQVPPALPQLNAQRLTPRRWLRSRSAQAIRDTVHDDHRLHPRLRQKRLDRSVSRPLLPRPSRSLRFHQTETDSCDDGERGSNIRDRGQIHLQFLLAKDRLSSRRNAIEWTKWWIGRSAGDFI